MDTIKGQSNIRTKVVIITGILIIAFLVLSALTFQPAFSQGADIQTESPALIIHQTIGDGYETAVNWGSRVQPDSYAPTSEIALVNWGSFVQSASSKS